MEPNLLIGDHLLVNKLVYSPSFGPLEAALFGKRPIERGHVVVFKFPEDPTRDFIKRVIGLPGETVEIRDNVVYVNGTPIDEPYLTDEARRQNGDFPPFEVPEDSLFVMGDNRSNSADSRYGLGYVPVERVIGKAFVVIWPPSHLGGLG
jgi:signal peptidase I